jgi:hypothetical protein
VKQFSVKALMRQKILYFETLNFIIEAEEISFIFCYFSLQKPLKDESLNVLFS